MRRLENICVIQPFSSSLFRLSNPTWPDRLIRKLLGEITADQAIEEWLATSDTCAEAAKGDPMATKHLCASCYLKGEQEWMLSALDFGVKHGRDFYDKLISQGQWTRCLSCMNDAKGHPSQQHGVREHSKTPQADTIICKRCVERDDAWQQVLTPGSHGCSACKVVFCASIWSTTLLHSHRYKDRDLVCPDC